MSERSKTVLTEILDWFTTNDKTPGDWWAPSDCRTSYGLDWRSEIGDRKFWLDLDKDGTITIYWKRPDGSHEIVKFDEKA